MGTHSNGRGAPVPVVRIYEENFLWFSYVFARGAANRRRTCADRRDHQQEVNFIFKLREAENQIVIDHEVSSLLYRGDRTVFCNRIPDVV